MNMAEIFSFCFLLCSVFYFVQGIPMVPHWFKKMLWEIRYRSPPIQDATVSHHSILVSERRRLFVSQAFERQPRQNNTAIYPVDVSSQSLHLVLEKIHPPEIKRGKHFIQRLFYRCRSQLSNSTVPLLFCFDSMTDVEKRIVEDKATTTRRAESSRLAFFFRNLSVQQGHPLENFKLMSNNYLSLFIPFTLLGEDRYQAYESEYGLTFSDLNLFCRQQLERLLHVSHQMMDYLNITFIGHSGTLLGSLRHHGSIPWDDDADYLIPFHDLCKILGFFSRGQPELYLLEDKAIEQGARIWWSNYLQKVSAKEASSAVEHFTSLLSVTINQPFKKKNGFALKLFFRDAVKPHPYSWTFPSIDFFIFQFYQLESADCSWFCLEKHSLTSCKASNENISQSSSLDKFFDDLEKASRDDAVGKKPMKSVFECIVLRIFYTQQRVPMLQVFPLVSRPFDHFTIDFPADMEKTKSSDLPSNFYSLCNNGGWSHLFEIGRFSKTLPCSFFSQRLPFVTVRQHRVIQNELLQDKLHFLSKKTEPSLQLVKEQLEFSKAAIPPLTSEDRSEICTKKEKNFRLTPNFCFKFQQSSYLSSTKRITTFDLTELLQNSYESVESHHERNVTAILYEKLSVSDILLSDIIAKHDRPNVVTLLS